MEPFRVSFGSELFEHRFPNTTFSSFFVILVVSGAKMESKMDDPFAGKIL